MRSSTKNRIVLGAHARGRRAYRFGLAYTSCPYPANPMFKAAWEKGWVEEQRRDYRSTAKIRKELEELKIKR